MLQAAKPAPVADDYLSIPQVAELVNVSEKLVRGWIEKGKYDQKGKLVKLFYLDFSEGTRRVPRSALLAFAQCQGFDTSKLDPAQLPQMRIAA